MILLWILGMKGNKTKNSYCTKLNKSERIDFITRYVLILESRALSVSSLVFVSSAKRNSRLQTLDSSSFLPLSFLSSDVMWNSSGEEI
jgi:hypothetical protein